MDKSNIYNNCEEIGVLMNIKMIYSLHKRLNEFVPNTCPACEDKLSKNRFEKYKCKFLECSKCGTIYMSPRPTS